MSYAWESLWNAENRTLRGHQEGYDLHLGRRVYLVWLYIFRLLKKNMLLTSCSWLCQCSMFSSKFLLLSHRAFVTPHELCRILTLNRFLGRALWRPVSCQDVAGTPGPRKRNPQHSWDWLATGLRPWVGKADEMAPTLQQPGCSTKSGEHFYVCVLCASQPQSLPQRSSKMFLHFKGF